MDGDIYDDLRHHFTLLCGTEMDACLTIQKRFISIWDSVTKVCVLCVTLMLVNQPSNHFEIVLLSEMVVMEEP